MNTSSIAIPYSKALFDLATERKELETVYSDMKFVGSVLEGARDLVLMLKNPVIQPEKKQKIINAIFQNKISTTTFSFLSIIVRKKREKYLADITRSFIGIYKESKGILTTRIRTAVPISPEIRKQVMELMKQYTNKEIDLVEEIQEDLIGGFVLNWEDREYDASILNQLNKLKKGSARINLFVKKI